MMKTMMTIALKIAMKTTRVAMKTVLVVKIYRLACVVGRMG